MLINVVYSVWSADGFDEPLSGGIQDVDVTTENAPALAAAAAAGVITIEKSSREERVLLVGHVQSQEDGEAARAAALGEWIEPVKDPATGATLEPGRWSGEWHDGNMQQFALDVERGVRRASLELDAGDVADVSEVLAGDA